MSEIKVNLDINPLIQYFENFTKDIVKDLSYGIEGVAKSAHSHIVEEAQNKLHSFREKYLENLSAPEKVDETLWVITLNEKAEWIEEGRPEPYDMKPGLLKNGKFAKDGHKYRVVPMNQAKPESQMSSGNKGYEQNMVAKVKSELKKRGINYKKLEIDPHTGSPRIGRLHSLDIDSYIPGKGNTPQLHGINIYQLPNKKTGKIERQITTFRTVTDKEDQKGKWIHPAVEGRNFFEEAKRFAEQEWETKWLPQILEKYK